MAYKSRSVNFGAKKKNRFLGVCIVLTAMGITMTLGLLGGHIYIASSINKSTTSVETISQNTESLKAEVNTMQAEKESSQKELTILEDNLAKYEPVVIPDSMK